MKKILITLLALAAVQISHAEVTMPSIFSNNMVLQQQSNAAIWGKSDLKGEVTITPSWSNKKSVAKIGKDGVWRTTIETPKGSNTPYTITVQDSSDSSITIENVLIGEVWFCSGQSNMAMPIKGLNRQPVAESADMIMKANKSTPIRVCTVALKYNINPLFDIESKWSENTSQGVANSSAVAYFFAKYLEEALEVPIGVIVSAWPGTGIQAWMSANVISKKFADRISLPEPGQDKSKYHQNRASMLYNAMIHPFITYNIKGILWYQGENNRSFKDDIYAVLMESFVEMMRSDWGLGEIPFYFVQIAPFKYSGVDNTEGAHLREMQERALKRIPSSGMAATMDIGDQNMIHPMRKRQVGERLARLALWNDYGLKGIDPRPLTYVSHKIIENTISVKLSSTSLGIDIATSSFEGFEIAGEDKVFHTAEATLNMKTSEVVVSSPEVAKPVAVRYLYKNYPGVVGIFNTFGVPAAPFRTDNWKL